MGIANGSYEKGREPGNNSFVRQLTKGVGRGNKPGKKRWERKGGGHQKKEEQR